MIKVTYKKDGKVCITVSEEYTSATEVYVDSVTEGLITGALEELGWKLVKRGNGVSQYVKDNQLVSVIRS